MAGTSFFENQEQARGRTTQLVFLFGLAVIGVAAAMNVVTYYILRASAEDVVAPILPFYQDPVHLIVTSLTLATIAIGTANRMYMLSSGGRSIAEMMGGELIDPSTTEPSERKLMNVVEEMAIASGIPVPLVYVISDPTINAFAAGVQPTTAVIGVTRGCMERLSRDELQGVIAHEFSHIFNGDMRLNLRLVGVLAGIQIIGSIGGFILRNVRSSGSSSRKKDNTAVVLLFGLAMFIIGYTGVFFARLIKSAVSRQREFLADASAVQYTRNPWGIGGALKKINQSSGAYVSNSHTEEMSHMFFAEALKISSLFATHPSLEERIRRIDPNLLRPDAKPPDPKTPTPKVSVERSPSLEDKRRVATSILMGQAAGFATESTPSSTRGDTPSPLVNLSSREVMSSIGKPTAKHVAAAGDFLGLLPQIVHQATHEQLGAQAIVCCLLLSASESELKQLELIRAKSSQALMNKVAELKQSVRELGPTARIPLVELSLPALKQIPYETRMAFLHIVRDLILADQACEMFEYVVYTILVEQLAVKKPKAPARPRKLDGCAMEVSVILSSLAHAGTTTKKLNKPQDAFQVGSGKLLIALHQKQLPLLTLDQCKPEAVENALRALAETSPRAKEIFLEACLATILADNHLTVSEYELIQAVCTVLNVPLPPISLPVSA